MSKNVYNLSYVSFWDVIHVFACLSTILTTFQAKLKATTLRDILGCEYSTQYATS